MHWTEPNTQETPLEKLKKFLKKARDLVDRNEDPGAQLELARAQADIIIASFSSGVPNPPAVSPTWDPSSPREAIGASLSLLDQALHRASDPTMYPAAIVDCRWTIVETLSASSSGGGLDTASAGDALKKLKDWLEKAKKLVGDGSDPKDALKMASSAAATLISNLGSPPAPEPPGYPFPAESVSEYMQFCLIFLDAVQFDFNNGDFGGARLAAVECKWSIDSFLGYLEYCAH